MWCAVALSQLLTLRGHLTRMHAHAGTQALTRTRATTCCFGALGDWNAPLHSLCVGGGRQGRGHEGWPWACSCRQPGWPPASTRGGGRSGRLVAPFPLPLPPPPQPQSHRPPPAPTCTLRSAPRAAPASAARRHAARPTWSWASGCRGSPAAGPCGTRAGAPAGRAWRCMRAMVVGMRRRRRRRRGCGKGGRGRGQRHGGVAQASAHARAFAWGRRTRPCRTLSAASCGGKPVYASVSTPCGAGAGERGVLGGPCSRSPPARKDPSAHPLVRRGADQRRARTCQETKKQKGRSTQGCSSCTSRSRCVAAAAGASGSGAPAVRAHATPPPPPAASSFAGG